MTNEQMNVVNVARRTRRLRLRLREHELSRLVTVAAKRGQYVAEFVREASLAAARSSAERLPTRPRNPALDLVALSEIQPEQVKWLWPGRIANGKLNIVLGDPGRRKVTDCAGHRGASDRREDYAAADM